MFLDWQTTLKNERFFLTQGMAMGGSPEEMVVVARRWEVENPLNGNSPSSSGSSCDCGSINSEAGVMGGINGSYS